MPRNRRRLVDGFTYHVLDRGNGKKRVFHQDQDFVSFIKLMKEAKKRFPVDIFAYCLMPNHFHFVLRSSQADNLSRWMHWLLTVHSRRYHHYYKTSGHIWQGRFKSFMIQNDEHLLTVLRYVEGNAVRAKLVLSSKDWPWSSHRQRISEVPEKIVDDLPIEFPYDWIGFVDEVLDSKELLKLRQSVNHQFPFGSTEWQKKINQKMGLAYTFKPRGRPRKDSDKKKEDSEI